MDNPGAQLAIRDEGPPKRRRFPWMSQEEYRTLLALAEIDAGQADEYERLVRDQARGDLLFALNVSLESELGQPGVLESIHGARASRWSHGCGGGRQAMQERLPQAA